MLLLLDISELHWGSRLGLARKYLQSASNEYPECMVLWGNKKILVLFGCEEKKKKPFI